MKSVVMLEISNTESSVWLPGCSIKVVFCLRYEFELAANCVSVKHFDIGWHEEILLLGDITYTVSPWIILTHLSTSKTARSTNRLYLIMKITAACSYDFLLLLR
jgi:hypothetical protein